MLFLVLSATAQAQALYKCVGKGGAVSYQSQPCALTTKVAKVYDATPEPYSAAREARLEQQRINQERDARELSRMAGTDQTASTVVYQTSRESPRDRQRRECAYAKSEREETLKTVGLARTIELLRSLDEMVYTACKGL